MRWVVKIIFAVSAFAFVGEGVRGQEVASNSIIVDARTEVVCKSMTQSIQKESRTITVLNSKGLEAAAFLCVCDMFNSLKRFKGELFNASGKSIRKIKKGDLHKSEYTTWLASDYYTYNYEFRYPSYPFTVKYEWEVSCNNGLIGHPVFLPQGDYNQEVKHASYRIELPAGQDCRHFAVNADDKILIKEMPSATGGMIIEATASGLAPIMSEPSGPGYLELFPYVHFSPSRFRYSKSEGDLSSWNTFGDWQYKLLQGRQELMEDFRRKLHDMTANCQTDREKVKVIYDYLAETTRYVSIQLGIGGLQPIAAAEVCRTGFGDCKGLSNYMKAMLEELGIPSTYTVINTVNKRLLTNFSSANQMNHVILQVPLPGDTLWLECTFAQLPFGYVHQKIAGNDALLIEPTGGRMVQLPTYPDSLNTQLINATVVLGVDTETKANVREVSRLFQYEDKLPLINMERNKQIDEVRRGVNLPQATINDLQISENKENHPSIELQYTINSNQYGQKTGSRLFVPINAFRKQFAEPVTASRTTPIHVNYGYVDADTIRIQMPDGYSIEGVPEPVHFNSEFGDFRSEIKVEGKEIVVYQKLFIPKGVYLPEKYPSFIAFRKKVSSQYANRIILKKD